MPFEISFVYNGYHAKVTSETIDTLELDIVECRVVLHSLPPAIRPVSDASSNSMTEDKTPSPDGKDQDTAGQGKIIPIVSIKEEKTRNGSKMYKVLGGEYEVWGVALYPDTCIFRDNLNKETFLNDVVSGLEAYVVKQDGKLRVAAVRRKQASV